MLLALFAAKPVRPIARREAGRWLPTCWLVVLVPMEKRSAAEAAWAAPLARFAGRKAEAPGFPPGRAGYSTPARQASVDEASSHWLELGLEASIVSEIKPCRKSQPRCGSCV